jgi:site-specific recombinase XerC
VGLTRRRHLLVQHKGRYVTLNGPKGGWSDAGVRVHISGAAMSGDHASVPAVIEVAPPMQAPSLRSKLTVPAAIAGAGDHAARRFLEFFAATIRNKNTRMAYYRAACNFFAWLEQHGIVELVDIEPIHVAAYVETLQASAAKPTVKQHLAAVRMLFDWLVVGQVLATNPAHAVRGPTHVVKRGKTPVLTAEQARQLLDSIDISTLVGLRDRALIAAMTYTLARVSAVVTMRVEDYYPLSKRWWVRLHEKGGKRHEMPAHHNLEAYLDAYIDAAGPALVCRPVRRMARGRRQAMRVGACGTVRQNSGSWPKKMRAPPRSSASSRSSEASIASRSCM